MVNGSEQPNVHARFGRRRFLAGGAALGMTGAFAALLAACGGAAPTTAPSGSSAAPAASTAPQATVAATQAPITINQNATRAPVGASATAGSSPVAVTPTTALGASGGTFTFARSTDSDNLDPVVQDGNINIWVFMNIYDQLIRVTDDGLTLQPMLAEKWEISADNLTYTFHLARGLNSRMARR